MLRDHVAVNAFAFFRKPFDEGCRVGDLAFGLRQGFALLGRHYHGQVLLIGHDEVKPGTHLRGAFFRGQSAPARQGGLRGLQRRARLGRPTIRDTADYLAICRIGHGRSRATIRSHPFAVDVAMLAKQAMIN